MIHFMLIHLKAYIMASFKVLAIITVATFSGSRAAAFGLQQTGAGSIFQHPAISAGLVAGLVAIALKLADMWWDARKLKNTTQQRAVLSADTAAELSKAERAELRESIKELHAREILFWQTQLAAINQKLASSRMAEAEARVRGHVMGNETMRLQGYIIKLLALLPSGTEAPPFEFRDYNQLMALAHDEIERARKDVRESGEINIKFNQ